MDQRIDDFVTQTRALTGTVCRERPRWNTVASADAVRHFCVGVGDDNPRWEHEAPPMFLTSVLYPMLHGAPVAAPLSSLIGRLAFTWHRPIEVGSTIGATARQVSVDESHDRAGRRLVVIGSEVVYAAPDGDVFGTAHGTMVRIAQDDGPPLLLERAPARYSDAEIERIQREVLATSPRHDEPFVEHELVVGASLPRLVVGPLTIGDLVCWQAAIGPSYRAGPLGLRDALAAPHTAVVNPVIGWPVKYSQQHEDSNLTAQRGMPAPFDNGAMRMSQMSRQLTDWMGTAGRLRRLELEMTNPIIYGDVTWFDATITGHEEVEEGRHLVSVRLEGTNQLGEVNTRGSADVILAPSQITRAPVASPPVGPRRSRPLPADVTPDVVELVLAHARADADRPAVRGPDRRLTYGELVAEAAGLAEELRSKGVHPGDVVAIAVDRTAALAVQVLGVLMSGAGYCPLEAGFPRRRLDALLAAARPTAIVATSDAAAELGLTDLPRVDPAQVEPRPPLPTAVSSDEPAYVIQTSGSQGSSKTVAVSRASLARYVAALGETMPITADDRYVQTASLLFSAASRQVWFPLSVGAELVIAGADEIADPVELLAAMEWFEATVWDTIPTFWARVCASLEALGERDRSSLVPAQLRHVFSTGEPLPWHTVQRWRALVGDDQSLVNLYSQTETAGTVCTFAIPTESADDGYVPLGTPMLDVDIHLTATTTGTAATGTGEIVVESDRLALGYVDDAELSEQRFIDVDGRRMYRTGDIGRERPDGILEIVGRSDSRLKIRGYRVDPVEVEAALDRLPEVIRSAAVARPSPGGGHSLVAYLEVATAEIEPGPLRAALADDLPDYAIPTEFEVVDQLPTTHTGKLDRSRLGEVATRRLGSAAEYHAPTTVEEAMLIELIEEVLGITGIGIDDDFVGLGGHSLAAIDLAARIQSSLAVTVGVASIFDNPTARMLAEVIVTEQAGAPRPDIETVDRSQPIPVSPMQEALFVLSQLHPDDSFNNIDWGIDVRGPVEPEALSSAFDRLIERHEALRTRFDFVGDDLCQLIAPPTPFDLDVIDLQHLPADGRRATALGLATEHARGCFDLRRGPLWRATLITEDPTRHVLSFVAHHSIADMYSVAILVRDLLALYDAARSQTQPALPPLEAQLADFVVWQHHLTETEDYAELLRVRAGELVDAPPIDLGGDRTPPPELSHEITQVVGTLSPPTTDELRARARDRKVTLFVAALAALEACLHARSGQRDLVVGCPFARRDRPELRNTVGMLVNTLPIRTRLDESADMAEIVTAVNQSARAAFAAVDVHYADLVTAVHGGRRPDTDLVEVLFQLQEDPLAGVGLEDLAVTRLALEPGRAMFPLQVSVRDAGDHLHITLQVTADRFSDAAAQQLLDDYLNALESLATLDT